MTSYNERSNVLHWYGVLLLALLKSVRQLYEREEIKGHRNKYNKFEKMEVKDFIADISIVPIKLTSSFKL